MARTWDEKNKDLQIKQREAAAFQDGVMNALMMIAGGREPNEEDAPYRERPPGGKPWEGYPKPYQPKLAHTPHTPESTYDDYGRPEEVPRYKGGNPGGQLIEIPWMKEEYKKKHPELEKLHNEKYHNDLKISQSPAALDALRKGLTPGLSSKQIRSLIKPYTKQDQFGHPTGSLRGV